LRPSSAGGRQFGRNHALQLTSAQERRVDNRSRIPEKRRRACSAAMRLDSCALRHSVCYRCVSAEVVVRVVSELCHMATETPVKHSQLPGHVHADRCCAKLLTGPVLVRFDARQHARRESISKRAPSTTRTSLRFRINHLRAVEHPIIAHAGCVEVPSSMTCRFSDLEASLGRASRKLCQTSESCPITLATSQGASPARAVLLFASGFEKGFRPFTS
jgi:hypothetical protein